MIEFIEFIVETYMIFMNLFSDPETSFATIIGLMFIFFFITWTVDKVGKFLFIFGRYFLTFIAFLMLPFTIIYDGINSIKEKN